MVVVVQVADIERVSRKPLDDATHVWPEEA